MNADLWKVIKNDFFIRIKIHVETNNLVKANKEIRIKVKFLLSKLHKCKEDKKILTKIQALDLFTRESSMMRDIHDEHVYSDTVNKLASLLAELSNKIVPVDITNEKSNQSSKKNLKYVRTLKKHASVRIRGVARQFNINNDLRRIIRISL